jgi:hypothetical protein
MLISWLSKIFPGLSAAGLDEGRENAGGDPTTPSTFRPDGWCTEHWGLTRASIHPKRLGGVIAPWAATLHTTDMHPSTFSALLRRAANDPGRGSGFHFLIGADEGEGTHQLASVFRNANHAGAGVDANGKARPHGWLTVERQVGVEPQLYHPNRVSVGIEVHCPGRVIRTGGHWRMIDGSGKVTGAPVDASRVTETARGEGWGAPTAYQLRMTSLLLDELGSFLPAPPVGRVGVRPNGEPKLWAQETRRLAQPLDRRGLPVFGHVDFDPRRKGDPGPDLIRLIALRGW